MDTKTIANLTNRDRAKERKGEDATRRREGDTIAQNVATNLRETMDSTLTMTRGTVTQTTMMNGLSVTSVNGRSANV